MFIQSKKVILSIIAAGLIVSASNVMAAFLPAVFNPLPCPVNAAYPDNNSLFDGSSLTGVPADQVIDAEFGPGAGENTQCLRNRANVKLVVRVNDTFRTDAFGNARLNKAMYFSNIDKFINQYENTHGLSFSENVDVRVILGGSGAALATTKHGIFFKAAKLFNAANANAIAAGKVTALVESPVNPYIDVIKNAMDLGIKFYLCQEASRTLKISNKNKIEGISYIPAAHAATADLQMDGYAIIIP